AAGSAGVTALQHDLVLGTQATTAPAVAGRAITVAAAGSAVGPVSSARVEVLTLGGAWTQAALLPATSSGAGWTSLGALATSLLAEGSYLVRTVALAPGGAVVDTTLPGQLLVQHSAAAPLSVNAAVSGDSVLVSWAASSGTLPVTYSVYRYDSIAAGYVLAASGLSGTTFNDSFLPGAAAITYAVTATDAVGNESRFSPPASITTPAAWNLLAPSVSLPSVDDAGAGSVVSASVGSHNGIGSFEFTFAPTGSAGWISIPAPQPLPGSINGGPSTSQLNNVVWAAFWNTGSLQGSYDVKVRVTDVAGNVAEQVRNVTFSGAAPRGPPSAALTATPIAGGVRLTWPTAGGPYQVRRSATGATGTYSVIAENVSSPYDDVSAVPGFAYSYQIWSQGSAFSSTASITAPLTPGYAIATPAAGGTATSASGLASVTLAPGSVAGTVALSVTPSTVVASGILALSTVYNLSAIDPVTGATIESFAAA